MRRRRRWYSTSREGDLPALTEYSPLRPSYLQRLVSPSLSPRYRMWSGTEEEDTRHIRVFTTQIGLDRERVRAPVGGRERERKREIRARELLKE